MIDAEYCQAMAAYNAWMNRAVYTAATRLSDEERKADRQAFFGSIHATLNHILWGDRVWLPRFDGRSYSAGRVGELLYDDFAALSAARREMDEKSARGPRNSIRRNSPARSPGFPASPSVRCHARAGCA